MSKKIIFNQIIFNSSRVKISFFLKINLCTFLMMVFKKIILLLVKSIPFLNFKEKIKMKKITTFFSKLTYSKFMVKNKISLVKPVKWKKKMCKIFNNFLLIKSKLNIKH
jgi:hypothetical protein